MTINRGLVCGVGVNDATYVVVQTERVGSKQKILWMCPFYQVWKDMLKRCYSEKTQADHPTYIGCSVAPEWHLFSNFRSWMILQDWEGKQLDKDIIRCGCKVYSKDSCVFVSSSLNKFMIDSGAARGEWPIGVNWNKNAGKFLARCCNPFTGNREHLGYFADPLDAYEAWRSRKHELACVYAEQQTDKRIASALMVRYSNTIGEPECCI